MKEVYTAVLAIQWYKLEELTADIQRESGKKNCSGLLDRWLEMEDM